MEILKQELMSMKNSHEIRHRKIVVEQEEELRHNETRIQQLEKELMNAKNSQETKNHKIVNEQEEELRHNETRIQELEKELTDVKNSQETRNGVIFDLEEEMWQKSTRIQELEKELINVENSQERECRKVAIYHEEELRHISTRIQELEKELISVKNSQERECRKVAINHEEELRHKSTRIQELENVNRTQDEEMVLLQGSLQELSTKMNETIESQHQIILVKDEALESCSEQMEQLQRLADQQSDEIFALKTRLEGLQVSADGDIKKMLAKEEAVKCAEKHMKNVELENKKLLGKIERLERKLDDKETDKSEYAKQLEVDVEKQSSELRNAETDSEEREKRITLLEDALRESVCIAAEREELLSQHIDLSDEASMKLQEHESMVDQFTLERHITNIKNAFLILSLNERDITIKILRDSVHHVAEMFFNWRQTALLSSISEKDSCIALFEMQSSCDLQQQEIKALAREKDSILKQLKALAQEQIPLPLEADCTFNDVILSEFKEASCETIFNATRLLIDGYEKLEYYVEQLVKFFKVKEVESFENICGLPHRNAIIVRKPEFASRDELLEDLTDVACDAKALRQYVDYLLNKLEEEG